MGLRGLLFQVSRLTHAVKHALRKLMETRSKGIDVRLLEPTKPMTDAERAERYRSGRFAEVTDTQAGL